MPEIIDTIKLLSHKVAEDYLLVGANMTDAIIDLYDGGEIENEEVAKRVCEHANQNVYLAKFHDPNTNKSDIKFDLADSKLVGDHIKKSENEMKDYQLPPEDFRSEPTPRVSMSDIISAGNSEGVKLAAFNKCQTYQNWYENLNRHFDNVKNASMAEAESAFNKMANDAKVMVANGDSIADIAKIAAIGVSADGLSMEKIARAYDIIHRELVKSGFHVKTEFTKVSSMRVNPDAEIIKPAREFALALEKVAAASEACENISKRISVFGDMIKKAAAN